MSEIRVDSIKAEDGISSPSFPSGIQVTGVVTATVLDATVPFLTVGSNAQLGNAGVVTATSFSGTTGIFGDFVDVGSNIKLGNAGVVTATTFVGALTGNPTGTLQTAAQPNITSVGTLSSLNVSGNVSIAGTLTYEDVTNVDSVGVITARGGLVSPYADIDDFISVGSNIHLGNAGIATATTFVGNLSGNVTGNVNASSAEVDDFISVGSNIHLGNAGIITATSFIDDGTNLLTAINTKATTGKAIAMAMIFG